MNPLLAYLIRIHLLVKISLLDLIWLEDFCYTFVKEKKNAKRRILNITGLLGWASFAHFLSRSNFSPFCGISRRDL